MLRDLSLGRNRIRPCFLCSDALPLVHSGVAESFKNNPRRPTLLPRPIEPESLGAAKELMSFKAPQEHVHVPLGETPLL